LTDHRCALVENWRVYIPPGGTEEHGINIRDPRWLIAVNAVSLVCALIANLSLLLNMARRIPFSVAQPITIIGFWVASILLIGLISAANASVFDPPQDEPHALTQAYYYAIFAAVIYQIVSYLMCITVYGAWRGHYSKEFKLTMAQRTLMLQTISFLVYQHLWALAYSHIEGWQYLDAIYWADFTSLTVGIGGSYTPKTHLGRSLLFIFALGGIIILGLVIGSIRSLVLDRGKRKMEARMTEKTRQRLVNRIATAMEKQNQHRLYRRMPKQMKRALTMRPGDEGMDEQDRRYYEFEAMRKVQAVATSRRKYFALLVSTSAFAFLVSR
jgi:potassium channel subfamily K, other eukaryote